MMNCKRNGKMMNIDFSKRMTKKRKVEFVNELIEIEKNIEFKMSSRGWCYFLENIRVINKDEFNKVDKLIRSCREIGLLPVDFVAVDEARKFSGIEEPEEESPIKYMAGWIKAALSCEDYFTPDYWQDEEYYLQMLVEKIDLKTLFEPICEKYHIPIANSKGWSSILQKADFARRFKDAEGKGLKSVLLLCGDFDPCGIKISDNKKKELRDLKDSVWSDGESGYDPENLIIDRFGLNYDFIIENNLTWIDNLITGSGKDLSDPEHPDHYKSYVQDYIAKYGYRKCEANVLVTIAEKARQLCENAILKYLGDDAFERFAGKQMQAYEQLNNFREKNGINRMLCDILDLIDREN